MSVQIKVHIALCIHTCLCTYSLWTDQWERRRLKLISWSIYISKWFHLPWPVPENQVKSASSRPSIRTALDSWVTELTVATRTPRSPQISACLKAEATPVTNQRLFQGSGFIIHQSPVTQFLSSVGEYAWPSECGYWVNVGCWGWKQEQHFSL